jgi:hypothetical protein
MIAFIVSVNGERVSTIGIGDNGVLSTHVSWSGSLRDSGDLGLSLGGLDSRTNEHVRYPDPPEIQVGDTVTIQVIETDVVDPPIDRKTPAQLREEEQEFLTEMEAEQQAKMLQKLDEELPQLRAPWELEPSQAAPLPPVDVKPRDLIAYAVLRIHRGPTDSSSHNGDFGFQDITLLDPGPSNVSVMEVVTTSEEARREIMRFNKLSVDKGYKYFWQPTYIFPDGGSRGTVVREASENQIGGDTSSFSPSHD